MSSVITLMRQLEQLTEIGLALSAEKNLNALLERILKAAKDLTLADGGTFYIIKDRQAHFWAAFNDSLQMAMGGSTGKAASLGPIPLYLENGQPNTSLVVVHTFFDEKSVCLKDVYSAEKYDFSGTRKFDEMTGYRSESMLTVPIFGQDRKVVAILQLINAKDPRTHQTIPFTPIDQRVVECLASMAAVAMTNRELFRKQEQLFNELMNRYMED